MGPASNMAPGLRRLCTFGENKALPKDRVRGLPVVSRARIEPVPVLSMSSRLPSAVSRRILLVARRSNTEAMFQQFMDAPVSSAELYHFLPGGAGGSLRRVALSGEVARPAMCSAMRGAHITAGMVAAAVSGPAAEAAASTAAS